MRSGGIAFLRRVPSREVVEGDGVLAAQWHRALVPCPGDFVPLPATDDTRVCVRQHFADRPHVDLGEDAAMGVLGGGVFVDGTADQLPFRELNRAGWGAVAMAGEGLCEHPRYSVCGVVPRGLPQTPHIAE